MKNVLSSIHSDRLGILSAGICLIHCILTPLLFGTYIQTEGFGGKLMNQAHQFAHSGFQVDYVFLAIGLVAVMLSSRHTAHKWIKALMWGSYGILLLSVISNHSSGIFFWSLYAASLSLIVAHIINLHQALKAKTSSRCKC